MKKSESDCWDRFQTFFNAFQRFSFLVRHTAMYFIARNDVMAMIRCIDKRIGVIILLYFVLSLSNIALKQEVEWFPLFSFKLFSRVPNDFTKYDIVFDQGSANEHYLLHGNADLNSLEYHAYQHWLTSPDPETFDIKEYEYLLSGATSALLVKFSGDFVEAAKYSKFNTEIVLKIK